MEATLIALGGILLRAVPTFLLVLILHFYLKKIFFQPLERILEQRSAATKGARALAEASFARAEQLAAKYEQSIREARAEIYREQEAIRSRWNAEQAAAMHDARDKARAQAEAIKADLSRDVELARQTLQDESDALADQIAQRILGRRAA